MENNNHPKVSIVLRSFNEQKHIGKLLNEIEKQKTSFNFETILVDSGSTDSTLDIAANYNVIVQHISPEEFTFGRSLNVGIMAAKGDVCVFTSAHCYPDNKEWLENIVKPFWNDDKVALVYGKQRGVNTTKYSEHQIFEQWFPDENIKDFDLPFCNNANAAIRKSVWNQYKYDEHLTGLEDMDWAKHIKKQGFKIDYRADALVRHVHEETFKQIYNRYYREAYAYKQIYPDQTFSILNFLYFWMLNSFYDCKHALHEGVFLKELKSIILFRFMQFYSTFKANNYKTKIDRGMLNQLYYPRKNKKISPKKNIKLDYIDITKPLSPELSVWPGNNRFEIIENKTYTKDGFADSDIKFNIHTGTHIDAPYHFDGRGETVEKIDLSKLIGKVLVVDHQVNTNIDINFLRNIKNLETADRIIFKTTNSFKDDKEFDKDFIAITEDAAEYLSTRVKLVGIDGPSIQAFKAPSNKTHEVLLKNKVVIMEGLNLKDVYSGWYHLLALPMKISGAEGAPVRAILSKGQIT